MDLFNLKKPKKKNKYNLFYILINNFIIKSKIYKYYIYITEDVGFAKRDQRVNTYYINNNGKYKKNFCL